MKFSRLLFVAVCFFAVGRFAEGAAASAANSRPNILFILMDDQRWDAVGHSNAFAIQTPNIDALAAEGVRFKNAFVTTPICAASRASILTGLYERTHRYTFGNKPVTAEHSTASYPRLLRDAGFRTGHVGKFGVGVANQATKAMYDSFEPSNRTPYMKKQADGSERHLTDIEADNAIKFIQSGDAAKPWCLSLCFNAPHAEDNDPRQFIWAKESDDLYKGLTFTPPATMSETFFESLPPFLKTSESRKRFKWRFDEPAKYQEMVRGYFRMIADVDRAIGRVRESIAKQGSAGNTIIIFTSDNGYFLGDRGLADKWYGYEESIRVPLIVVDPRLKDRRGVKIDAPALNVDLAPTILALAGLPPHKQYQGQALTPLLKGESPADWRKDFFFEHLMDANGPGSASPGVRIPKSEGVRNDRFTYIRWFQQDPLVEELYDHEADSHCTKNLVADHAFASVADSLRKRTTELRDQYGGPWTPNAAERTKRAQPE